MYENKVKSVTQAGVGCWPGALLPLALFPKESSNFLHGLSFGLFISSIQVLTQEVGLLLWLPSGKSVILNWALREHHDKDIKSGIIGDKSDAGDGSSQRNQPHRYFFILPIVTMCNIVLYGWSIRRTVCKFLALGYHHVLSWRTVTTEEWRKAWNKSEKCLWCFLLHSSRQRAQTICSSAQLWQTEAPKGCDDN